MWTLRGWNYPTTTTNSNNHTTTFTNSSTIQLPQPQLETQPDLAVPGIPLTWAPLLWIPLEVGYHHRPRWRVVALAYPRPQALAQGWVTCPPRWVLTVTVQIILQWKHSSTKNLGFMALFLGINIFYCKLQYLFVCLCKRDYLQKKPGDSKHLPTVMLWMFWCIH